MTKHALYATSPASIRRRGTGEAVTFRIGQPVDWNRAIQRHERATNNLSRRPYVRHLRRKYPISFYEVRAVDEYGRGLGRNDHALAIPVHGQKQHRIR